MEWQNGTNDKPKHVAKIQKCGVDSAHSSSVCDCADLTKEYVACCQRNSTRQAHHNSTNQESEEVWRKVCDCPRDLQEHVGAKQCQLATKLLSNHSRQTVSQCAGNQHNADWIRNMAVKISALAEV